MHRYREYLPLRLPGSGPAAPVYVPVAGAAGRAATTLDNQQRLRRAPSAPPEAAFDRRFAAQARAGLPSVRLPAPEGGDPVDVFDTPAAYRSAARLGVAGFSWRGDVFLGSGLDTPDGPGRERVLRHELAHALQARQDGAPASRPALEHQAEHWRRGERPLASDPEDVHGFLWVPFVIAGGYILLKPNTANAPGPGDKTYPSMTPEGHLKMIGEAAVAGSGGLVAGAMRKAGFSLVTSWGASGAVGSMGFRAVGDISGGEFSGVETYVVDGLTGAVIGVVVSGTFHAAGKLPGLNRVGNWFQRGAENDPAWAKLPARDKLFYEIGQKSLPNKQFEPFAHLGPVERGRAIVAQQGWLRALFPRSPKFIVPGEGGTLGTGPTPAFRWAAPRALGGMSGMIGRHGFLEDWEDPWLQGASPAVGESSLLLPDAGPLPDPFPRAPDGSLIVPPGARVITVVPEGRELEYYLKSGQIGDFNPLPLPPGHGLG